MKFSSLGKSARLAEKFAIDNSPVLLTAMGVAGIIGTAILTHKAALKAEKALVYAESHEQLGEDASNTEKLKVVYKHYIPPVLSGAVTIGCVVMANHIGTKRAAAMAAAYTVSERAFTEYREKVIERLGENQDRKLRDEIAQDRIDENPVDNSKVIIAGSGDVLCYDAFSGRYFTSNMESLRKAENDINYQILNTESASLTDFYQAINIPRTSVSEELGWNSSKLLELHYSTSMSADNRPCISIDFTTLPIRNYWKHG